MASRGVGLTCEIVRLLLALATAQERHVCNLAGVGGAERAGGNVNTDKMVMAAGGSGGILGATRAARGTWRGGSVGHGNAR